MEQKKNRNKAKTLGIALGIVMLAGMLCAGACMHQFYRLRVCCFRSLDNSPHGFYVYPGTTPDSLLRQITAEYELLSPLSWRFHAAYLKFDTVRPGYYRFPVEMGTQMVINHMKLGFQDPITLRMKNSIRTQEQLSVRLASQLLLDSADIACRLDSAEYMQQFGLTKETAVCLFIPNSYEVYWTMKADELFARMYREYQNYWTPARMRKAQSRNLSATDVATLASIVSSETHNEEEWPEIASLYQNRLRIGMRLQADPTVVFASRDFTTRRVTNRHLAVESPYNTYRYAGLPPGPIRLATATAMDAVLDAPNTDYLYMCASPDFSGRHVFTSNYGQHAAVARRYRQALNQRKIH